VLPWWAMILLGAAPGAALGALVDWLFRRGAGRERDLAVQRGTDLRASLTETEATLTLERARRVQDCARLEEDLRGSEAERHRELAGVALANAALRADIKSLEQELDNADNLPALRVRLRRLLQGTPALSVVPAADPDPGDHAA